MPLTVTHALHHAQAQGLARLDAQMLVLHALGRSPHDRAWLLAHGDTVLDEPQQRSLHTLLARRAAGEPMAYITGTKEFYGMPLAVDARVLDPRADTETLVDWALEAMDAWTTRSPSRPDGANNAPPQAIDLGTGSGAIALALQSQRPAWHVYALDFSTDALTVAQANAKALNLPVQFRPGNWLADAQERFALIVSNPPYIPERDAHLAALTFEPLQALASGADGLDAIRTIISQAPARLLPGAWLLLEHGYDQAPAVRALLTAAGFHNAESRCDLAGIERCSGAQWAA